MIIPRPCFEPVQVNYATMSFLAKILYARRNPPRFCLTTDWLVTLDDGFQLIFPRGFVTDFASVPRMLWWLPGFSPFGPLLCGSIAHDFGYQHGYFLSPYQDDRHYPIAARRARAQYSQQFGANIPVYIGQTREFFDNIMAGLVIEESGAAFVANSAKCMLNQFGGLAWRKYRRQGPGAYNTNSLGLPGVIDGKVRTI